MEIPEQRQNHYLPFCLLLLLPYLGLFFPQHQHFTRYLFDPRTSGILIVIVTLLRQKKGRSWERALELLIFEFSKKRYYITLLVHLAVYFTLYKILFHMALMPSGSDFAHFDYALWNASHGRGLDISIIEKGSYFRNLLGNHFALFLFVLSPFYWISESHLWPSLFQVMAMIGFFVTLRAFTIYSFQDHPLKKGIGLLVSWAMVFSPLAISTFRYEFHVEIFYFMLVIFCWMNLQKCLEERNKKNVTLAFLSVLLMLSVKEDSCLILLGMALALSFRSLKVAIALALFSLGTFYSLVKIAMPAFTLFKAPESFLVFWGRYGHTLNEIILNMLSRPDKIFVDIFTTPILYKMMGLALLLPLMSPFALAYLPLFALHFTASDFMRHLGLYYGASFVGMLSLGIVLGLKRWESPKNYFFIFFLLIAQNSYKVGNLVFPSPHPSYQSLSIDLKDFNPDSKTIIQGHLLPLAPYSLKYTRLWNQDLKEITTEFKTIILHPQVEAYPLHLEERDKLISEMKNDPHFTLTQLESGLLIFKSK